MSHSEIFARRVGQLVEASGGVEAFLKAHDLKRLDVRQQLAPGLSVTSPVPLSGLARDTRIEGVGCIYTVRARCFAPLPPHRWAVTIFDDERAWIWLHRHAWAELVTEAARTRFSLAHELCHVAMHDAHLATEGSITETENEQIEAEADRFAAHLLIPDQALKRLPTFSEDDFAKRFGVSPKTAERRMLEWKRGA